MGAVFKKVDAPHFINGYIHIVYIQSMRIHCLFCRKSCKIMKEIAK